MDSKRDRHLKSHEIRKLKIKTNLIDFASNDYLGFTKSPKLKALILEELSTLDQIGSTGSRLLTGNSHLAEELERDIALYHGAEAALLFSSGYLANIGLISAVCSRDDLIIVDEKIHASTRDGIALSRAKCVKFPHNDLNGLKNLLKRAKRRVFIIAESIYSTDGSLAPIEELSKMPAHLIIDEAHAIGVFGPGLVKAPTFARIYTFGKALGVQGAAILGSQKLKDYLITKCRPFIYTTAMTNLHLIAIKSAYKLLKVTKHNLIELCNHTGSKTPILNFTTPKAKELENKLQTVGFDVRALVYPTVARGEESLRICLHTYNTKQEIDDLYGWIHHFRN